MTQGSKPALIYGLMDPRLDAIRYVGKTVNPAARYSRHCNPPKVATNDCQQWEILLRSEGIKPKMVILETVAEGDWQAREIHWISTLRGTGILNMRDGGDGPGPILPEVELARRAKISRARKGMRFSAEHRALLSDKKIQYFASDANRCKLSRHNAVLTDEQVIEVIHLLAENKTSQEDIASRYGIAASSISEIRTGKRYRHVTRPNIFLPNTKARTEKRLRSIENLCYLSKSRKSALRS